MYLIVPNFILGNAGRPCLVHLQNHDCFSSLLTDVVLTYVVYPLAEWERTSLGKSVKFFRLSFLQPLLKSCKVYWILFQLGSFNSCAYFLFFYFEAIKLRFPELPWHAIDCNNLTLGCWLEAYRLCYYITSDLIWKPIFKLMTGHLHLNGSYSNKITLGNQFRKILSAIAFPTPEAWYLISPK